MIYPKPQDIEENLHKEKTIDRSKFTEQMITSKDDMKNQYISSISSLLWKSLGMHAAVKLAVSSITHQNYVLK